VITDCVWANQGGATPPLIICSDMSIVVIPQWSNPKGVFRFRLAEDQARGCKRSANSWN